MSLVSTILSGVAKAQKGLQDLVILLPIISKSEAAYDKATSTVVVTDIIKNVDAVPIDWDDIEIDGTIIMRSDIKMVVFSKDVPIDLTDLVSYNGGKYKIMSIKPIRVGTHVPARILQLRA